MKTVSVKFDKMQYSKVYHYIYDLDEPVERNDILVVVVSGEYKLVTVQDVTEGVTERAFKHIVDKLDVSKYKKREENERKRKALRIQLDALLASQEEILKYRWLAEHSPNAAALIRELEELNRA